jgi:hypothetical protein
MSQKLKSKINAIFVQLNRYTRQRKDFAAEVFLRDLSSYFETVNSADISGDVGRNIDEQLKTRVNTIPRNADPMVKAVADLMVLYFWYLRRPGADCSSSLVAAKKMRGQSDDSQFIESVVAPQIFGGKIKGFGKYEFNFRDLLLRKAALIARNFRESDQIPASATRVVRTDSWHKKMLHVSALHQAGRLSELPNVTPREELHRISSENRFAAWYLRVNDIYQPENRFWLYIKRALSHLGALIATPLNLRLLLHIFRNRLPVYLVYLALTLAFVYGAIHMKDVWRWIHTDQLESMPRMAEQLKESG